MVDFSGRGDLDGFFAPQRFEADVYDCEVVGRIPVDLDGAFVRVGSAWDYPPLFDRDSPFNEDGYVSRFRFKGGVCSFKGRWVQTERYRNNHAAGRQLYGLYRNPFTDDPAVRDIDHPGRRTAANTAPMAHGGKLFALKEDGLPHEIDPVTLETLGIHDFGGRYRSQTFTAHPKTDPVTGELIAYGYEAGGLATNDVRLFFIDKAGGVRREVRFQTPYVSMLHDIAISERHIVFPVMPYVTDMERLKAGQLHWAWDYSLPMYYGVMPRDGEASDIRWFKGPQRAVVHTLNARTEGDKVILEAPIFDGNPFPFFPFVDGSEWDPMKGRAFIRRVTFDLASKDDGYVEELVFPGRSVVDLVRIDERFTGLPYRYGYTSYSDDTRAFDLGWEGPIRRRVSNSYGRFDLRSGKLDSYFAGPHHSLQEVCFVPRPGSTVEGDGYIIGTASNFKEMRSELIIADAQDLAAGDIARVILPFRSTVQVHGKWFTPEDLPRLAEDAA